MRRVTITSLPSALAVTQGQGRLAATLRTSVSAARTFVSGDHLTAHVEVYVPVSPGYADVEMQIDGQDPSTLQVANALIKANKTFDLFVFPGGEHGVGRRGRLTYYGNHKQWDYFVHHLLGVEPPNRNAAAPHAQTQGVQDDEPPPHGSLFSAPWDEIEARWGR